MFFKTTHPIISILFMFKQLSVALNTNKKILYELQWDLQNDIFLSAYSNLT